MAELKRLAASRLDALTAYLTGFEGIQNDPAYWRSRFRLWWDENPAFTPGRTRGWTLDVKGRIVGFLGCIPSRMIVASDACIARSLTTWMVDAPFRNDALAMLLELLEETSGEPVFDTTPTDRVAAILKSLAFEPVPWGPSTETLYAAAPRALAGVFLGTLLSGWQRFRSRLKIPRGLRVGRVEAIAGPDYDALWEKTRGLYRTTNVRDAAAVRWAALADPIVEKHLYECRDAGKLRGYLILKPRRRRGVETFECVDLWFDPDRPEAFDALVARAAQEPPLVSFPHFTLETAKRLDELRMLRVPIRARKNLWLPPKTPVEANSTSLCLLQGDYGTAA